jgi:hypothetical protein
MPGTATGNFMASPKVLTVCNPTKFHILFFSILYQTATTRFARHRAKAGCLCFIKAVSRGNYDKAWLYVLCAIIFMTYL